jgi:hypothetical protein
LAGESCSESEDSCLLSITRSFQQGDANNYSGAHDAYIRSAFPTTNYGNEA